MNEPRLPLALEGLPEQGLVVAGFSGGADSTALVHALSLILPAERLLLAHVNHGLRGAEAERDEAAVRALAARLGLRLAVCRADVGAMARARGMGLEACGRALRYDWFSALAPGEDDRILTAHTADDNAETLLLHLIRGAGLEGLCGIPRVRGRLLRPMLEITRAQVEAYCRAWALPYVQDSSNGDPAFARSRLRQEAMPVLRGLNPRLTEAFGRTAGLLTQDAAYLRELALALLESARAGDRLAAAPLREAPAPLRTRAVKLWLEERGCRDLEQRHLDAAEDLIFLRGRAAQLPGGRTLRRSQGLLWLEGPAQPG